MPTSVPKRFGSNIGWEATHLLGSTLAGKPPAGKHFGWEATWEALWLGSTLAGKPFLLGCCLGWEASLSGKTQGGGRLLIRYPLPNAAATSQALSDVWHDFFQIVLMFALRLGSHLLGT